MAKAPARVKQIFMNGRSGLFPVFIFHLDACQE
jgi:hypothetical protein